ncbi:MAG: type II toxin-antitoxin system RelE/ParE family toxin [Maritimibacter harenae]
MTHALLISPRAEADLEEIWLYSLHHWGREQADRYLATLAEAIKQYAHDPERGRARDEIRAGYRSARVERHVVFYQVLGQAVVVQRVLHASMDPDRHL